MHGYAQDKIDVPYSQIIHPNQFGHPVYKSTCLWLAGLPPLTPTTLVEIVSPDKWRNETLGSKHRGLVRSITFQGIAEAMADQWGGL